MISDLPDHLLIQIASHCDPTRLHQLVLVSQRLYDAVQPLHLIEVAIGPLASWRPDGHHIGAMIKALAVQARADLSELYEAVE